MLVTQTAHSALTVLTVTHDVTDTNCTQCTDSTDSDTQTAHSALTVLTEAPHINTDFLPLTVFMLFCFEITQLLFLCSYRAY